MRRSPRRMATNDRRAHKARHHRQRDQRHNDAEDAQFGDTADQKVRRLHGVFRHGGVRHAARRAGAGSARRLFRDEDAPGQGGAAAAGRLFRAVRRAVPAGAGRGSRPAGAAKVEPRRGGPQARVACQHIGPHRAAGAPQRAGAARRQQVQPLKVLHTGGQLGVHRL